MKALQKSILFKALFLLLLDQLTKAWVRSSFEVGGGMVLIPRILEFRYVQNTGISFSLLAEHPSLLTALISVIVLALFVYIMRLDKLSNLENWSFACIFGGALANLLDRYALGFVVDFINPIFINFAVFNIADTCLNIGVGLLLIAFWQEEAKAS